MKTHRDNQDDQYRGYLECHHRCRHLRCWQSRKNHPWSSLCYHIRSGSSLRRSAFMPMMNLKKSVDRSILLLICCSYRKSVR
jgi:hypothetical protein